MIGFWDFIALVDLVCQLVLLAAIVTLFFILRRWFSSFQRQISDIVTRLDDDIRGIE